MKFFGIMLLMIAEAVHAQTWDSLVDRYFNESVFPANPSAATTNGFHQWDAKLEDFSNSAREKQISVLHRYEREISAFPAAKLNAEQELDRDLVFGRNIRAALLELETVRMWERNPDLYSSTASYAAFVIMSRKFAPAATRLAALVSREKQMPGLFAAARSNLRNPPRIYAEVAIEQLPGILNFFRNDVPLAFQDVADHALIADFQKSNAAVVSELESYLFWLQSDLLPPGQRAIFASEPKTTDVSCSMTR